jgi:hypothetical protein
MQLGQISAGGAIDGSVVVNRVCARFNITRRELVWSSGAGFTVGFVRGMCSGSECELLIVRL